jgi:HlyD family secretion protein
MRAALRQAEIDLERSVIRAPIDGVVIGRDVDRGQTVAASLEAPTLFTIAQDLRQMEVHARIDEADIGRIRSGQSAHFTVDAFPNRSFTGSVVQIRKAAQVVQNVVTYTVVILTENPDLLLLPGMTALVRITVSASGETATIPSAALRYEPSDETVRTSARQAPAVEAGDTATGIAAIVWMLPNDDDRPRPIRVRIGMDDGSAAQLLHGDLESGDALVVGESLPESEGLFSRLRLRL